MKPIQTKGFWTPPARSKDNYHRVSLAPGYRPIETRKLPWQWKLAEFPMRWLARLAANTDNLELITGEERIPDTDMLPGAIARTMGYPEARP